MTVTSYRSVPSQTDSSPYYTSIGEHVHPYGIAISQNLLKKYGGPLDYGDVVYINDVGFKVVNDVMNKRYKNCIDVWVKQLEDEKAFHKKFKGRKLTIWLVKSEINETHKEESIHKRKNWF